MMNATLAFSILASSVPPLLLIVLPRYVNESVSSSGSPFHVMGLLFFVLAFIILVLLVLMLNRSCVDIHTHGHLYASGHVGAHTPTYTHTGKVTVLTNQFSIKIVIIKISHY